MDLAHPQLVDPLEHARVLIPSLVPTETRCPLQENSSRRPAKAAARRTPAWLVGPLLLGFLTGCHRAPPPGADRTEASAAPKIVGTPAIPSELLSAPPPPVASGSAAPGPGAPPPWPGPYLLAIDSSAGVFSDMSLERKQKIGYLRSGSRVPVLAKATLRENCSKGWYQLRDGGYVCGNAGTTNTNAPEARFALRIPDWDGVLPYTYARNAKNGTPLYKSVPTQEQMLEYEPYLGSQKDSKDGSKTAQDSSQKPSIEKAAAKVDPAPPFAKEALPGDKPREQTLVSAGDETKLLPDGGAVEDDKPWWQRTDADKRLHEVKLDELSADADDVLAKRMVKGFYVAVDREFVWNGRTWYKTTKGLVAPSDRFWVTQASDFKGVELDGEKLSLPMGWTYGWQKGRPKYALDEHGRLMPTGSLGFHVAVALTGKEMTQGSKKFVECKDGSWVQADHLRITQPGPPPADLGPDERWIDVNLKTQTLVAFEGVRPVFATLVSSGKESKDKEKDHRSPTGEWRIREKHVTTTMDGDGSAAGDLPYSIEDVPYVMYFHRAFALHGAFWHSNYGVQMSHGCVNLAPLDAKWVFRFTGPNLPEGWHGVWATAAHPGSRVVVHE